MFSSLQCLPHYCGGHGVPVTELQNPVTIIHYILIALYSPLCFSLLDGCLEKHPGQYIALYSILVHAHLYDVAM